MVSTVYSTATSGIDGYIITIECDGQERLPHFDLVGLPDAAVKESKERVRAAAQNSGFPLRDFGFTVNLAPADRLKSGTAFDVAILLAILKANTLATVNTDGKCFIGDLSLTGGLRRVNGVLPMCLAAKEAGIKEIYVPLENAKEAVLALASGENIDAVMTKHNGSPFKNGKK